MKEHEWNFKKELARKLVHFLSLFVLLIYFVTVDLFSRQIAFFLIALLLVIFLEFEYLRIEVGRKIPFLNNILNFLHRRKEKNRLGAHVYFLIGAILVISIFDMRIAIAAILMTTFGDLAAALIGKRFGRHFVMRDRAWEGVIAEFFVDIIIGILVFFWGFWAVPSILVNLQLWIVLIVMAITATFVETVVYKLDDNLLIPVFAGFNGQVALILLRFLGFYS